MADVVVAARREGRPVMAQAACMGHKDLLAAILSRESTAGSLPDAAAQQEMSAALLGAAERGHEPCVQVLLDACPDLAHAKDDKGRTALHWAAFGGYAGCMHALLRHDPEAQVAATTTADCTVSGKVLRKGCTPLTAACAGGHAECVQTLLEHSPGMQVACVDAKGINALSYACYYDNPACATLVLRHDPDAQLAAMSSNDIGLTPLMFATHRGSSRCVQLMLQYSLQSQRPNEALRRAAACWAKALAEAPGGTPLAAESAEGYRRCVELLLSKGEMLPPSAPPEQWAVVQPVIQDCVARSLVPSMANEAVVGLALAEAETRKRRAEREAAGPSGASSKRARAE